MDDMAELVREVEVREDDTRVPEEGGVPGLVRRIRRRARLSQSALGKRLGVSQSTIARWEVGASSPTAKQLEEASALAGLRLALIDADGQAVPPMRADSVRNHAGRRPPPFTDPKAGDWRTTSDPLDASSWWRDRQAARARGEVRVSFHRKAANAATPEERQLKGLDDHPTYEDLVEQMDLRETAMELRHAFVRRAIALRGSAGNEDESA